MVKGKTKKKTKKVKKEKVTEKVKKVKKVIRYFEGLGRRKTAVARVRLFSRRGTEEKTPKQSLRDTTGQAFLVNEKPLEKYFPTLELKETVLSSLKKTDCLEQFKVSVKVKGGGPNAQAEAVRYGIARALVLFNPDFRKKLKKTGFLTRDPRMRERKKFGLKRARRAPQWQKR